MRFRQLCYMYCAWFELQRVPAPARASGRLHFDERVRVAVAVHGGELRAADDADEELLLLRVVAQRQQDAATLVLA